jgi:1,4-dihydroxy-2-naphthoyl-CoA hydrolase
MKLRQVPIDQIEKIFKNTLMQTLNISVSKIGDDFVEATMPVTPNVHQPMGLLHGGASAALIESIGSIGSVLLIDTEKEAPVGIEINANHLGSMRSGTVRAHGKLVHAGKRTHVWQVDLFDDETAKCICTGRLTVMIVPRNHG